MEDKIKLDESKIKHVFVDADTICVRAATICQNDYMVYKDGKKVGPAQSIKKWREDNPDLDVSKYEFKKEPTLCAGEDGFNIEKRAEWSVRQKVKEIQDRFPNATVWPLVQDSGIKYRDLLYPDYKGNRATNVEILLRKHAHEYMLSHFSHSVLVTGQIETDDRVSQYKWNSHKQFIKKGWTDTIVAYIDKDIDTTAGWGYNYDKGELKYTTPLEACRFFLTQTLYGDTIDGIKGANGKLSDEFYDKWKPIVKAKTGETLRKSKSVGETTARRLMSLSDDPIELHEIVKEVYQDIHQGRWLEALQEECVALYMQRKENDMIDIEKRYRELGIDIN